MPTAGAQELSSVVAFTGPGASHHCLLKLRWRLVSMCGYVVNNELRTDEHALPIGNEQVANPHRPIKLAQITLVHTRARDRLESLLNKDLELIKERARNRSARKSTCLSKPANRNERSCGFLAEVVEGSKVLELGHNKIVGLARLTIRSEHVTKRRLIAIADSSRRGRERIIHRTRFAPEWSPGRREAWSPRFGPVGPQQLMRDQLAGRKVVLPDDDCRTSYRGCSSDPARRCPIDPARQGGGVASQPRDHFAVNAVNALSPLAHQQM